MTGQRLGKRTHGSWKLLLLSAAAASWHSSLQQVHTEQLRAARSVVAMVPEPGNSGPSLTWIAGLVGAVVAGLGFAFAAKQRATSEPPGTPVAKAEKTPATQDTPPKVEAVKEEPVNVESVKAKAATPLKVSPPDDASVAHPASPEVPNPQKTEARKVAGDSPTRGDVDTPTSAGMDTPTRGGTDTPTRGGVLTPTRGGMLTPTRGGMVTGLGVLSDTLPNDWQSLRESFQQAMIQVPSIQVPSIQAGAAGSLAAKVASLSQPDLIVPPAEFHQVQQAMQSLAPDWFSDRKPEATVAAGAGKALASIREAFTTGAEATTKAFTTGAEAAAGAAAGAAAEASRVAVSFKTPRRQSARIDPML